MQILRQRIVIRTSLVVILLLWCGVISFLPNASTFAHDEDLPGLVDGSSTPLLGIGDGTATIKQVAFSGSGGYVLLWGRNGYRAHKVPTKLLKDLEDLNKRDEEIKQVAFVYNSDGYAILYGLNGEIWTGVSNNAIDDLNAAHKNGADIRQIEFLPSNADVVLYGDTGYSAYVQKDLSAALSDYHKSDTKIDQIAAVPNINGYVLIYNNRTGWDAHLTPTTTIDLLKFGYVNYNGKQIVWVATDPSSGKGFVLYSDGTRVGHLDSPCISNDLDAYLDKLNGISPIEGYQCLHS